MLKTMISFIAATLLGYLGHEIFGLSGMFVGAIGGYVVGWYVAKRLVPR
jgi:hypothetical protein